MSAPLISIITPVYNTCSYLGQAVGSVLEQTMPDWELLLVDDGSTDGSGALCDQYAGQDPRIRVFHQENAGVSRARNKALSMARGQYLCFLDSDDWWEKTFLEELLKGRAEGGDIPICCGYVAHHGEQEKAPAHPWKQKKMELDRFLYETLMGRLELPLCCVTWLLPAEEALKHSFDEHLDYGEDSLFVTRTLLAYPEVFYDPKPLYHYRTERAGNTYTEHSLKKSESRYASIRHSYELCRGRLLLTEQVQLKHLVESASEAARAAKKEGQGDKYRLYKKRCIAVWKRLCSCPDISPHDKIRLLGYGLAPVISEKLMLKVYGRV